MSRAIEDYVCASEDRPHYNNETWELWGFQYPMRSPKVINIREVIETKVIKEEVPEEKLNELIDARIPHITEVVTDEVNEAIIPTITEVHGGSATEVMDDDEEG
jgi:cell division ATPase FtsA